MDITPFSMVFLWLMNTVHQALIIGGDEGQMMTLVDLLLTSLQETKLVFVKWKLLGNVSLFNVVKLIVFLILFYFVPPRST